MSILKSNDLWINCLCSGHFVRQYPFSQRCRKRQKPHYTLLHLESRANHCSTSSNALPSKFGTIDSDQPTIVLLHVAQLGSKIDQTLLMTCRLYWSLTRTRKTRKREVYLTVPQQCRLYLSMWHSAYAYFVNDSLQPRLQPLCGTVARSLMLKQLFFLRWREPCHFTPSLLSLSGDTWLVL